MTETESGPAAAPAVEAAARPSLSSCVLTPVTDGCGASADDLDARDPRLTGWVLAAVLGCGQPPRYYCSLRCSARGIYLMKRQVKTGAKAPGHTEGV